MSDAEKPAIDDADSADSVGPSNRQRLAGLGLLAAVLLAVGVVYLMWASNRVDDDLASREARALDAVADFEATQPTRPPVIATPTPTPPPIEAAAAGLAPRPGEVLVVNRVPGDDYGRLAIRHSDGSRTLLDRSCLRVHIGGDNGVCLSEDEAFLGSHLTSFFPVINPAHDILSYPSVLPSRARISPDGRFSATTGFISGSSYADISGDTSTLTIVDEIEFGASRTASGFSVNANDSRYTNEGQYWGITFGRDDDFYVTGFYGELPEIMRGSLNDFSLEPTGWIGSCPSLSPDGQTLIFKEQRQDGGFDLVAVNVATQEKRPLAETRSVDDQVEWLDNDTILYALHPEGGDTPVQPEFDIWMLDIALGTEPVLFLPGADSPAVAR